MSSPPYTHTLLNPIKGDMSQPGVPPDLRVAVAMPSFSEHAHQWPAPHHMPMPAPQYTPRSSWDLAVSSYPDASSGSAGAGSGPAGEGEGIEQQEQQQQQQRPHPHPHPHLHSHPHSPSHTRVLQRELSAALPGEQGGVKDGALHSS